jgi:hypothetical protein
MDDSLLRKFARAGDVANSKSTNAFWTELTSICSIESDVVDPTAWPLLEDMSIDRKRFQ